MQSAKGTYTPCGRVTKPSYTRHAHDIRIFLQVASAMQYLHSRNPPVIHRDLKPENVLLDPQNNAKVIFELE